MKVVFDMFLNVIFVIKFTENFQSWFEETIPSLIQKCLIQDVGIIKVRMLII